MELSIGLPEGSGGQRRHLHRIPITTELRRKAVATSDYYSFSFYCPILPERGEVMRISQPAFMFFGYRICSINVEVRFGAWHNVLFNETIGRQSIYQQANP